MLRIKAEKWNEFCQNAESLGFKDQHLYVGKEYRKHLCCNTCSCREYASYIKITPEEVWFNCGCAGDAFFDLIQLGYIEKI